MSFQKLLKFPSPMQVTAEKRWILNEAKKIGLKNLALLAQRAAKNRAKSYSPYSHYKVGAALLAVSGKVFDGANMERASYSETDHGEEAAVTNALLHGEEKRSGRKFIRALAVSHDGDTAPCGRCRQILVEHADNAIVLVVNPKGAIVGASSLKMLLPYAFTPSDLENASVS